MNLGIGELSRRAAVKVPTIRYYEEIGLLPQPMRTDGQQRRYGEAEVARLTFIRHARALGFELDDIRELLAMSADPEQSCRDADGIAARHLVAIQERISRLQGLADELTRMIGECRHDRLKECRVLQVLADHAHCAHDDH